MQFVDRPRVELVSQPVVNLDGLKRALAAHARTWPEFARKLDSNLDLGDHDGEWLVELAGHFADMDFGGRAVHDPFLRTLIEDTLGSPALAHASFGLVIWGVSQSAARAILASTGIAGCLAALERRGAAGFDCVVPPALQELSKTRPEVYAAWIEHMEASRRLYDDLLAGVRPGVDPLVQCDHARQIARSVLPDAAACSLIVTARVPAIRGLILAQARRFADPELRQVAVELFRAVRSAAPLLFCDLEEDHRPDGAVVVPSAQRACKQFVT